MPRDPPGVLDALLWMGMGALLFGWVIWTPVGRELAVKSISRGAKVAEEKVRRWLEEGER